MIVDWGDVDGKLPANIWCFVKIHNVPESQTVRNQHRNELTHGSCFIERGVYAVVESSNYKPFPTVPNTDQPLMFRALELEMQGNHRKFYLVDTEAFVEPCFIIPDYGNPNRQMYFQIANQKSWPSIFKKWTDTELPGKYTYDKSGNLLPKPPPPTKKKNQKANEDVAN